MREWKIEKTDRGGEVESKRGRVGGREIRQVKTSGNEERVHGVQRWKEFGFRAKDTKPQVGLGAWNLEGFGV